MYQVQTSCGFGVPFLDTAIAASNDADPNSTKAPQLVLKDRKTLSDWVGKVELKKELQKYQAKWNSSSLDGLPGMRAAVRDAGKRYWVLEMRAQVRRVGQQRGALLVGVFIGMVLLWGLQITQLVLMRWGINRILGI